MALKKETEEMKIKCHPTSGWLPSYRLDRLADQVRLQNNLFDVKIFILLKNTKLEIRVSQNLGLFGDNKSA